MKTTRSFLTGFIALVAAVGAVRSNAAPGELDLTFGGTGKVTTAIGSHGDYGESVVVQSDGKVVVVGSSSYNGSNFYFALARYNVDGTLDTSFNSNGKVTTDFGYAGGSDSSGRGVVLQSDGKIVVAGTYQNGGTTDFGVIRYNANGSLDTTFRGTGKVATDIAGNYEAVRGVAMQTDGKIIVVGHTVNGGKQNFALVRYNGDGNLDTAFNGTGKVITAVGSGDDIATTVAVQTDGKIVAAGYSYSGATIVVAVVRYNANGSLDTTFSGTGKVTTVIGSGGNDQALSVAMQSDGKIVVAGLSSNGSDGDFALLRYNSDGSLDATFNGTGKVTTAIGVGDDAATGVKVQGDGKIVAGGYGNNNQFALARFNPNGSLDVTLNGSGKVTTALGSGPSTAGTCVALSGDGKIVVAGRSSNGGKNDFAVVRYEGGPTALTDGLVGHWTFSGNANDSSGNGHHGVVTGAVLTTDRFGQNGRAYDFNGSSSFIDANGVALPTAASSRTVTLWLKTTDLHSGRYGCVFNWGTFGLGERFGLHVNNGLPYFVAQGGAFDFQGTKPICDGLWHFVAITYDGTKVQILVDGVLDSENNRTLSTVQTVFRLGGRTPGDALQEYFHGNLDEVRIYNRALSPAEVQQLYASESGQGTGQVTQAWVQRYNGPANLTDVALATAMDASGNVAVTGYSMNANGNADYYTAKYAAANGALVWEKRYNGTGNGNDYGHGIAIDTAGNVVVTGASERSSGNSDYYTAKYAAADGALIWEQRYNGTGNGRDVPSMLALDSSENVVVTGLSFNSGEIDMYTAKYAAASGALIWEKRYDGPSADDYGRAVAVDSAGNVAVTAYSFNGTNQDIYTAKYAAASGALIWEKRYNGPANQGDIPTAIAVDSAGNVVVVGISDGGATGDDYYTAKYASATGALMWERRYSSAGNDTDNANAVAVDSAGNVFVTGHSGGANGLDYYTAKYAADTGAIVWEKRYDGPVHGEDRAYGIAEDGAGNVIVTGQTLAGNGPPERDFYTAKYAATDGALLWQVRYNGPASNNDVMEEGSPAVESLRYPRKVFIGSGFVVVTGQSSNGSNYDYAVVKYVDNFAPLVTLVSTSPFTFEASATYTDSGATANDVEDGPLTPTITSNSVVANVPGAYTVTWTATDGAGAMGSATRVVNVVDTTAPVVAAHANVSAEATSASGATVSYAAGTASDTVGVTSITYSKNSGTVFPLGVTTVTITAKDAADNTGTGTFTVTVEDTTAPVVAIHANVTVEATSAAGATVNYTAGSATDAVGVTSITYSQNSGTVFPLGVTTVTITANDAANNTGTGSFTVTVQEGYVGNLFLARFPTYHPDRACFDQW